MNVHLAEPFTGRFMASVPSYSISTISSPTVSSPAVPGTVFTDWPTITTGL